jgi:photosystem II stability/assembly factor-like uncharacterized protein
MGSGWGVHWAHAKEVPTMNTLVLHRSLFWIGLLAAPLLAGCWPGLEPYQDYYWDTDPDPDAPPYICPYVQSPTILNARAVSTESVYLSWNDVSGECDGKYRIERRALNGIWEDRGMTQLLWALDSVGAPASTREYRVAGRYQDNYSPTASATTFEREHWLPVPAPTDGGALRGLAFADDRIGYACGDDGMILKTTDAGATWFAPANSGGPICWLYGVAFANASLGIVVGTEGLWLTRDGGQSWTHAIDTDLLYGCAFASERTAVAVGTGATLYRTTDAGEHWVPIQISASELLMRVAFADSTNGWIGGSGGSLFATEDGGLNWSKVDLTDCAIREILDLACSPEGTLFAACRSGILRIEDGYPSWSGLPDAPFIVVACADAETIFAGGGLGLYRSRDGGWNWQPVSWPLFAVNDIAFADPSTGIAAGTTYRDNSHAAFVRTTDGGAD